ncbi:MAG TPA: GvpL/GvpF family gas vesicle protein [Gemmatimonadaceae bacterium]|nr:GvpL/GvpF family gas vesicle protein [Gemmatimonadaceae bacterium]
MSGAVRLFGIIAEDWGNGGRDAGLPAKTMPVVFRDLAAVIGEAPGTGGWRRTPAPPNLDAHRRVVEDLFAKHSVLPVPPGVVFRSSDAVVRWLEIHYAALSDALAYVDGRAEARVHVEARAGGHGVGDGSAEHRRIELDAVSGAVFKALAATAVGWCTLPAPKGAVGDVTAVSASFLVDRAQWPQFEAAVAAEGTRDPSLGVWASGPWPPYDFVRMQFGG